VEGVPLEVWDVDLLILTAERSDFGSGTGGHPNLKAYRRQ